MQIAEKINPHGMASTGVFSKYITELIWSHGLKKIIETGSYLGLGTTRAIRNGLSGGEIVYSIEVNPEYHKRAKNANMGSGIHFVLGLSVGRPELPVDFSFDVPDYIVVDHLDHNRAMLYTQEVGYPVPDNMLDYALSQMDYEPDLVILDSAGHMGMVELKYLLQRAKGSYYLCLDDTNHVKHYDSMLFIKQHPEQFEVIFETDDKFGSAIIKVSAI